MVGPEGSRTWGASAAVLRQGEAALGSRTWGASAAVLRQGEAALGSRTWGASAVVLRQGEAALGSRTWGASAVVLRQGEAALGSRTWGACEGVLRQGEAALGPDALVSYPCALHIGRYEPWTIVDRLSAPWHDARFRAYGQNKIVHIAAMNASGYQFVVLSNAFIVHRCGRSQDAAPMHPATLQNIAFKQPRPCRALLHASNNPIELYPKAAKTPQGAAPKHLEQHTPSNRKPSTAGDSSYPRVNQA
eukprot:364968-Chlamydomonas_euryale.AAC.8